MHVLELFYLTKYLRFCSSSQDVYTALPYSRKSVFSAVVKLQLQVLTVKGEAAHR